MKAIFNNLDASWSAIYKKSNAKFSIGDRLEVGFEEGK